MHNEFIALDIYGALRKLIERAPIDVVSTLSFVEWASYSSVYSSF